MSTREKMINAALDLFHAQGVNATSIDQILEKSSTGKGQFSHYFKSKEGLVHATLQYLHEVIRDGHAPTGYKLHSWKDLNGWFDAYIKFQQSMNCSVSCPIGTIGNDITEDQDLLRQDVRLFLQWSRGELTRFFAEKKTAGELTSAAKPEALADLCLSVMQGGMLVSKLKRDTDVFENAAAQVLTYIQSLRIKKKT